MKNVLFTAAVTAAFGLGICSLLLAAIKPQEDSAQSSNGPVRTALPNETSKIDLVLGDPEESGIVYTVVNVVKIGDDPRILRAATVASLALEESGLEASVRVVNPDDDDFDVIVEQNEISRFPTVLAAKRGAGVVLVSDEINEKSLEDAYRQVLGRSGGCALAAAGMY